MNTMLFEFSDTIAGYVTASDPEKKQFKVKTTDGREFSVKLTPTTYGRLLYNLDESYMDCTGQIDNLLVQGQYLFAYGIFYPQAGGHVFEAKAIDFPGKKPINTGLKKRTGG